MDDLGITTSAPADAWRVALGHMGIPAAKAAEVGQDEQLHACERSCHADRAMTLLQDHPVLQLADWRSVRSNGIEAASGGQRHGQPVCCRYTLCSQDAGKHRLLS
jgi:chorismate synthase